MKTYNVKANVAIDFSRSAVSRYIQLASLFRSRVESGEWPIGEQIPTVDDLALDCSVARATIRQALDLLEEEKLIARYRAKGTFVIGKPQDQFWCEVATDWSNQLITPEGAMIEVLVEKERLSSAHIAPSIGQVPAVYRHWRNGKPYCLGDLYIDEKICAKIPKKAFETQTAMRILTDISGLDIAQAEQILTLGSADPQIADFLQMPLNAPIAHITLAAVDQSGYAAFFGKGIYRGDAIRFNLKLK